MKRLFSAIARAFRAMSTKMTTAWRYCTETGKWLAETVASIGGGGGAGQAMADELVPDNDNRADQLFAESHALLASIDTKPHAGGDGYDRVQRVCRVINLGDEPAAEDVAQLTAAQWEWINTMTPEMRLVVGNEDKALVVDHMRGRKSLRGVLCADAESVQTYKDAIRRDMDLHASDFELLPDEPEYEMRPIAV